MKREERAVKDATNANKIVKAHINEKKFTSDSKASYMREFF